MNLRKEPVLFVVVLLWAAWIWSDRRQLTLPSASSVRAPEREYVEPERVPVTLAPRAGSAVIPEQDLFREPTEAVPLPPRDLPYPELARLPVVTPPLQPGPEAGAFRLLREAGAPPERHAFDAAGSAGGDDQGSLADGDAAGEAGSENPDAALARAAQDTSSMIPDEVMAQRFDRIWRAGHRRPFYGNVLNPDKLELVGQAVLPAIRIDLVSQNTGEVYAAGEEFDDVERLEVADNLENRIALRKMRIPPGPAGERERVEFLGDLLDAAKEQPWVFQEAEAQAQRLLESTGGSLLGYRWLVRVLRAQGALSREWQLYQNLSPKLADSAARWREQGRFEAGLTLWEDAEAHLRKAVSKAPNDARSLAALAQFLLDRGRAPDALPLAERAGRNVGTVTPEEDRTGILRTVASTHLALGDVDAAAGAVSRMGNWAPAAERAYLLGCIEYARAGGDGSDSDAERRAALDAAAEQFERAAGEQRRLDAVLGLGCVRARQGAWDRAHTLLSRVRDEAPGMRARALAALGYLYARTGNAERSAAALAEAERVDPRDPYVSYLAGRRQRLDGDPTTALETVHRALAERDDLTEAFGEISMALLQRADLEEGGAADLMARAARYASRGVLLDGGAEDAWLPYLELQGYVLAQIGEVVAARQAFTAAVARGSDFADLALALLDYRSKRVSQARTRLATIADDPGRDDATRAFARQTVALIDDHAGKEQVRDDFDRDRLGDFWVRQGSIRFSEPLDGRLRLHGDSGPAGQPASLAREPIAAGNLLGVAVDVQVTGELLPVQTAGIEAKVVGTAGRRDFRVMLGWQRHSADLTPELQIVEGATQDDVTLVDLSAVLGDVDPRATQRLEIELVPDQGEGASNRFGLVARWNGVEVHRVDRLRNINARSRSDLVTALTVRGRGIEVVFDDYRLVRRRAQ